jgi:hypothetical protein
VPVARLAAAQAKLLEQEDSGPQLKDTATAPKSSTLVEAV